MTLMGAFCRISNMTKKSKYYQAILPLLRKPAFSIAEALQIGIPRHALSYFEKKGMIERIAKGTYRDPGYEEQAEITLEDLAIAAYSTRNSIICLISALEFYDLTDQIPREHWLAIPHSQRAPSRQNIRAVRMRNIELGQTTEKIGEYKILIFDRERCIVDAFRYLSIEIAIKALQAYLQTREYKPDIRKLQIYAKQLRVNIKPYILSLTT